mmetsp:Transcript_31653/g.50547  ORF Transcript_31653/g.50547 Transcript_31653/m.50547 type:complete len:462 (-) Transcript_31653:1199-2584(-)
MQAPSLIIFHTTAILLDSIFTSILVRHRNTLFVLLWQTVADLTFSLDKIIINGNIFRSQHWYEITDGQSVLGLFMSIASLGLCVKNLANLNTFTAFKTPVSPHGPRRDRFLHVCSIVSTICIFIFVVFQQTTDCSKELYYGDKCDWIVHPLNRFPSCDCRMASVGRGQINDQGTVSCINVSLYFEENTRLEYLAVTSLFPKVDLVCPPWDDHDLLLTQQGAGESLKGLIFHLQRVKNISLVYKMSKLKFFDFSGSNSVSNIPPGISALSECVRFSMQFNRINDIPLEILDMPKLEDFSVHLTENPVCARLGDFPASISRKVKCNELLSADAMCGLQTTSQWFSIAEKTRKACRRIRKRDNNSECDPVCKQLVPYFMQADKDSNWYLDKDELKSSLIKLGYDLPKIDRQEVFFCLVNFTDCQPNGGIMRGIAAPTLFSFVTSSTSTCLGCPEFANHMYYDLV